MLGDFGDFDIFLEIKVETLIFLEIPRIRPTILNIIECFQVMQYFYSFVMSSLRFRYLLKCNKS